MQEDREDGWIKSLTGGTDSSRGWMIVQDGYLDGLGGAGRHKGHAFSIKIKKNKHA